MGTAMRGAEGGQWCSIDGGGGDADTAYDPLGCAYPFGE